MKRVLCILIAILIGVCTVGSNRVVTKAPRHIKNTGVVTSYLQALCDKNYELCDSYVAQDGFQINNFIENHINELDNNIYTEFMDLLVDSIVKIQVTKIVDNTSTGYKTYTIKVSYIPYKKLSDLDIDSKKFKDLLDKYVQGKYTDNDLSDEFKIYCSETFKNCFQLDSKENKQTVELKLSERSDESGVPHVYNTKNFINDLIPMEMRQNLSLYEQRIQMKIDTELRQY